MGTYCNIIDGAPTLGACGGTSYVKYGSRRRGVVGPCLLYLQILDRARWQLDGYHRSAAGSRRAYRCNGHRITNSEGGKPGIGLILRGCNDYAGRGEHH